ncbi:hypothetical protein GLAREA_12233 [Glarea lozoyensis ATCC 20868]|uniref:Uncharacterized protein n=1 Tax=Glarea lozoyensis (strain ATCC 20868 / MF5171) TaxID=1116229 RepID=S3CYX0_GLAL2|nr:uncharacterized protein GLAREA_12233 [Glarea lozoyensis ATCC 20868]EPE31477.1 hypothetical protein GLAREA_12233 [Glarea lozoyensis ATCC 20868]
MEGLKEFTIEPTSKGRSNTVASKITPAPKPEDDEWKFLGSVESKKHENTINDVVQEGAAKEKQRDIKHDVEGKLDPVDYSWGKFGAFKGKEKDKTPDEGILKGGSKKESGEAIQQPGDKDDWEFRGPITTKKKKKKKKKKKTILEGATVEDVQEDIYCEAEDNSEEIEETRGLGAAENKKKMKDDNLESPSIEKPRSLTPSSAVDYWKTTTLISDSHPKRTPMDEDMGVYEDRQASSSQVPSPKTTQIHISHVKDLSQTCLQQTSAVVPAQISSNVRSNTLRSSKPLPPTLPPPSRFVDVFEFMDRPKVEEMPLAQSNANSNFTIGLSEHITAPSNTSRFINVFEFMDRSKVEEMPLAQNNASSNSTIELSEQSTAPSNTSYRIARTGRTWTRYPNSGSISRKRVMMVEAFRRITRQDYIGPNDLEDMYGSGSSVTAFVIQGAEYHQIPCTGYFALRRSNLENIHTSGSISWKDFAFLSYEETLSLTKITENEIGFNKSLIRLKWLRKSRMKFWSPEKRALVAIIHNNPISLFDSDNPNSRQQEQTPFSITRNAKSANTKVTSAVESKPPDQPFNEATTRTTKETFAEMTNNFIIYAAYTVRVFASASTFGDPASVPPSTTKEEFSEGDIMQRISILNETGMHTIDKKLKLLDVQQEAIIRVIHGLNKSQVEPGFVWNLAQLEESDGQSIGSRAVTVYLRKKHTGKTVDDARAEAIPAKKNKKTRTVTTDNVKAAMNESAPHVVPTKQISEEEDQWESRSGTWGTASEKDKMKRGKSTVAEEKGSKEQSSQKKRSLSPEILPPPNESSSSTNGRIPRLERSLANMAEMAKWAQAELQLKKDQASQAQEDNLPTFDSKKAREEEMTTLKQQGNHGQSRKPSPVLFPNRVMPEPASYSEHPQSKDVGSGDFPNAQYPSNPYLPQSYVHGGYPTTQPYFQGYPLTGQSPFRPVQPYRLPDHGDAGRMMAADPDSLASHIPPDPLATQASYSLARSYANDIYSSGQKRPDSYHHGVPQSASAPYRQVPPIVPQNPQPPKEARFSENPVVPPKLTKESLTAKSTRRSDRRSPSPSYRFSQDNRSQAQENGTAPRTHGITSANKTRSSAVDQDFVTSRPLSNRFAPPISQSAYSSRISQRPLLVGRSDPYVGPTAFGRRTAARQYPENYDGRPFNVYASPMEIEEETKIMRELFLDWTPEGDEKKAESENRTGIDSNASRPNIFSSQGEGDDRSSDSDASS